MIKKLTSSNYSEGAFNTGILIFRLAVGILLMHHGYDKLVHYSKYESQFINFMGMSPSVSLYLTIFAEFFCSLFVVIGLFTRLASVAIVINMSVAVFKAHNFEVFGAGEMATLFLAAFLLILFVGPGKISVDGMIGK